MPQGVQILFDDIERLLVVGRVGLADQEQLAPAMGDDLGELMLGALVAGGRVDVGNAEVNGPFTKRDGVRVCQAHAAGGGARAQAEQGDAFAAFAKGGLRQRGYVDGGGSHSYSFGWRDGYLGTNLTKRRTGNRVRFIRGLLFGMLSLSPRRRRPTSFIGN